MDQIIAGKLIGLCWLAFIVYWFLAAIRTKRTVWRQSFSHQMFYRVTTVLGIFLALFRWAPPGSPLSTFPRLIIDPLSYIAGVGICYGGLAIAIWARRTIASNWSGDVVLKENHELVQTGPYRFVRHPIYSAILLMALGSVISQGRPLHLIGVFLLGFGFWVKLKQEEGLMIETFGEKYAEYKVRVRALIPFIL